MEEKNDFLNTENKQNENKPNTNNNGNNKINWKQVIVTSLISVAVASAVSITTAAVISAVNFPKYTVTFKNDDGTILEQKSVALGQVPSYSKDTPIKPDTTKEQYYDYEFSGWDKEFASTITNTTYTATYSKTHQVYQVTYYDSDGKTILDEQKVNKGEEPTYKGKTPIKPSTETTQYRFSGWKKSGSQETGSITFVADYDSAIVGLEIDENGVINGYKGNEENITIPSKFGGVEVKEIAQNAFTKIEGESNIKTITLPDTIEKINSGAFASLTKLESVKFPNNEKFTEISDNLFYNCTSIKEISIPDSITSVGSNSFYGCTSLEKMKLGKNVIDINTNFFTGCENLEEIEIDENNPKFKTYGDYHNIILNKAEEGGAPSDMILIRCLPGSTSVTIPDEVRIITSFAFLNCKNLTSINLNQVTQIDDGAFKGCGMETFDTGDSVTKLGKSIFEDCNKLTEIELGNSIAEIDPTSLSGANNLQKIIVSDGNKNYSSDETGLLYDYGKTELLKCPQSLESVTIPIDKTLVTIGSNAFQNCEKLTSISIPANIKTIKSKAFQGCKGLTELDLGESVTSIESYVISGCENLTKVILGKELKYEGISLLSLQGCTSLSYINVDSNNKTLMTKDGVLFGKSTANSDEPISLIRCPYKFDFGDEGKYEIPKTVTEIKAYAFKDVKGLKYLTIHDGITTIGEYMSSKSSLNTLKIDGNGINTFIDNISTINTKAFTDSDLETIEFKEINSGTKNVINSISINLLNYKKVIIKVLSDNKTIPSDSFNHCTSFKSIIFEEGVTEIGNNAFKWCSQLTEIDLPTTITTIGDYAFNECTALKKLSNLPNLKSIGNLAFSNCKGLEELDFTSSNELTSIGDQSFRGLSSLKSLKFSKLETIGKTAITDNTSLTTLELGDELTSVSDYGIANNTALTNVTLPASLISEVSGTYKLNLGQGAFQNCISLTNVHFKGNSEVFKAAYDSSCKGKNVFTNTNIGGIIHCEDKDLEL